MESRQKEEMERFIILKHKNELCAIALVVIMFMSYVVDRTIAAVHMFPSPQVLTASHLAATAAALALGRRCRLARVPPLDVCLARHILLLTLTFCARILIFSARLNFHLPALSLSRHLNVLVTYLLDVYVLETSMTSRRRSGEPAGVATMTAGVCLTAFSQSWSWSVYLLVILDNSLLAVSFVYLKVILDCKAFGVCGVLFYDSLFRLVPAITAAWVTDALSKALVFMSTEGSYFYCHLCMSCLLSVVQSLCTVACVDHNGALTTVVLAALVNSFLSHTEWMIVDGLRTFYWTSLVGFVVSMCGSWFYVYVTFNRKANSTYEYDRISEVNV